MYLTSVCLSARGGGAGQKRLPVGLELRSQLREHLGKSGSDIAGDGRDVGRVECVVRAAERMDVAQRPVDRAGGHFAYRDPVHCLDDIG